MYHPLRVSGERRWLVKEREGEREREMLSERVWEWREEREREREGELVRADWSSSQHHHCVTTMLPVDCHTDRHTDSQTDRQTDCHTDIHELQSTQIKANSCIDESLESTRRMLAFCEEVCVYRLYRHNWK